MFIVFKKEVLSQVAVGVLTLLIFAACTSDRNANEEPVDASRDSGMERSDGGEDPTDSSATPDVLDLADTPGDSGNSGGDASPSDADDVGSSLDDAAVEDGGAHVPWIVEHFEGDPVVTGDFTSRQNIAMPVLVRDASGTNAKYAFAPRNGEPPLDNRVGFYNVTISDLVSTDAYGGGIGLSRSHPVDAIFFENVEIEPNWPEWVNYDTTNYDGIVLDGAAAAYGKEVVIRNWNADAAIDNKAQVSQFVGLTTSGAGHRTMRYWAPGPHYLVASELGNTQGSLLWFRNCDTVELHLFETTFNGQAALQPGDIECDEGSNPNLIFRDTDPRQTGEMHQMFLPR